MSYESLIVILAVGLIAGWLAGQIVRGTGFGIIGDLIIGRVMGAYTWASASEFNFFPRATVLGLDRGRLLSDQGTA